MIKTVAEMFHECGAVVAGSSRTNTTAGDVIFSPTQLDAFAARIRATTLEELQALVNELKELVKSYQLL